jgi:EAL domain-containing protein (putative c-di-GMP-specific phosphodiesterase class I)
MLDADLALYESKDNGRGQLHFATAELTNKIREVEKMRLSIVKAIEEDRFEPIFQPQVDLSSNCVVGAESLARLVDENGEMQSGACFIELANEYQLLDQIDRIIVEKSLAQFGELSEGGISIQRLGLNLSNPTLSWPELPDWLEERVSQAGIQNHNVSVEVMENVLLNEDNIVRKNLETLTERGFHIALDHFGVGQASINTLLSLNVDEIKIDRSLVKNIDTRVKPKTIVASVTRLARELNINVMIEGVEKASHVTALKEISEYTYQGFLFARPMRGPEFVKWLNESEFNCNLVKAPSIVQPTPKPQLSSRS